MAGNKRPSYLKRQKEQQRMARAAEKREAKRVRKASKGALGLDPDSQDGMSDFAELSDIIGPSDDTEL